MPVLKVLLLGALGGLLATSYLGVLPEDARKHLNKLVFSVFTPALVFSNLVQAVSLENIVAWWFLPVNVVLTFVIGGLLGLLVIKVFKPQPQLVRLTLACCSAGNVGNLPLVLIPAVCMEPKSPFKQTQVCIRDGLAYVSFGLALYTSSRFSCFQFSLSPKLALCCDAPLRLIQDSLSTLGNAMLPSMILLLGGNLSQGSTGSTKMKSSVVAGIVVAKLVVVPMLGLCVVSGAAHLRLIPLDPLFQLVLLLQYTMPTAMTIGIITQLFGVGEQVSVVLLWSYLSSVVTTTLWTMLYIWLLF
ncbi:hypothetical protein GOP47_0024527 [Adiantum capillus-veneris]|uniref:Auxin efflux carrier family protein n=1 Tax=Adiantum capillus-veneris TaxID=13818 RepID=A0A9D4U2F6_ADICA|nr:hypothetical protein GOP47_0024527 [Adiantum capillus-veneris]